MTTNKNTSRNATHNTNQDNDIMPGTNLTWAEAGAMAKDHARDQRGDNLPSRASGRRSRKAVRAKSVNASGVSAFERETGWSFGDALEMAVEARSDARLFGRTQLYV